MRLDLFLKTSRLVKRRTVARELIDAGRVQRQRIRGQAGKRSEARETASSLSFLHGLSNSRSLSCPSAEADHAGRTVYRIISDTRSMPQQEHMERRPLIVITMGDPAGIGPEIIAKVFAGRALRLLQARGHRRCRRHGKGRGRSWRFLFSVRTVSSLGAGIRDQPACIPVLDLGLVDLATHAWGRPDASSGTAVVEYIKRAVASDLGRHRPRRSSPRRSARP